MNHGSDTLGAADIERMQSEGWQFPDTGWLRVGNGWTGLAMNPDGHWKFVLLADPDDEPEKFPQIIIEPANQPELFPQ